MPAVADFQPAVIDQLRPNVTPLNGQFRKPGDAVETPDRVGYAHQRFGPCAHLFADGLEQFVFSLIGLLSGRQRLRLKLLELVGNVSLGVLDRLPAHVIARYAIAGAVGHLDVIPEDAVESDLQVADGRAFDLALLKVGQPLPAVPTDGVKTVQLGVEGVGDKAALTH